MTTNKKNEIKEYAKQNFDKCFGLSIDAIYELMHNGLSKKDMKDLEAITTALDGAEFVVVGSAALATQDLLNRTVNDIDIVIAYPVLVEKLKESFNVVDSRNTEMSSNEFKMFLEEIHVHKYKLPSGRILDVFEKESLPKYQTLLLDNTYVNVEIVKSVIEAKYEYIKSGNLSIAKLEKQRSDIEYIKSLTLRS